MIIEEFNDKCSILKNGFGKREINEGRVILLRFA
jgi:hypothetical protein